MSQNHNSNHPNAYLWQSEMWFNWAFVAAGQLETDIGVAEVGLPPSDLNSDSREEILGTYSLKNVFTNQINLAYPGINPNDLSSLETILLDLQRLKTEKLTEMKLESRNLYSEKHSFAVIQSKYVSAKESLL